MGKKTEEYFVQRGGKWVPIDMSDDSEVLGSSKESGRASEEYYVRRGEKWVKISGARSKDDLVAHLGGGGQQSPAPARAAYRQDVRTVVQSPPVVQTEVHPTPQEPLEYREYFITVNPPPPESERPQRVENDYVEPPPRQLMRQRLPPEPIVPQQRPVLRGRPPPPPAPPNVYHVHNHYPPPVEPLPPPLPPPPEPAIMKPRVEWDAFEMGRRAFYEQSNDDDDDDDGGVAGPPRTSPAPGYYLAGYLYYGDPSSAPELRPHPGI